MIRAQSASTPVSGKRREKTVRNTRRNIIQEFISLGFMFSKGKSLRIFAQHTAETIGLALTDVKNYSTASDYKLKGQSFIR